MMENTVDVVQQQALGALQALDVEGVVSVAEVVESVMHRTVYWEKSLHDSQRLLFVRLFSPVVMRDEVFLGNVLLNAFLTQAFARTVEQAGGVVASVANDLESYYFLIRTDVDLPHLMTEFGAEVARSLPELFFGEADPARGIYGSLETMLDFEKANVEPFPVFILPQAYASRLEQAVRKSLLTKIEKSAMDRNPTSIMANLAFFYSHDGTEMQSPYLFLVRLALRYGILNPDELWRALNLDPHEFGEDESAAKKATEEALKQKNSRAFSPSALRRVLSKAVAGLGAMADSEPADWLMPWILSKFLSLDDHTLAVELVGALQVGHISVEQSRDLRSVSCRLCGARMAEAEDKSILMGQNTHKFHNQSAKQKGVEGPKACLRCAICTYLAVKLLGSEAVGQPQVPKTYNLVFHYGQHDDEDVAWLAQQIDKIWSMVSEHRQATFVLSEISRAKKALDRRVDEQKNPRKRAALEVELAQKEDELRRARADVARTEEDAFAVCPWMRTAGESPVPFENPALDVFGNLSLSSSGVERHVLALGTGTYRLILFVLPQLRAPRGKARDFAQSRFSDSWLTITAFLSFLSNLCGCDGPYYYQSLPTLSTEALQPGMFYVRHRPIRASEVQRKYAAIYNLAWKLVPRRGPEGFVKKVILAEKLLDDPLGTFSAIMRDSAILGQRKGGYKKLNAQYRSDWGAYDLTDYVEFIQQLSDL